MSRKASEWEQVDDLVKKKEKESMPAKKKQEERWETKKRTETRSVGIGVKERIRGKEKQRTAGKNKARKQRKRR